MIFRQFPCDTAVLACITVLIVFMAWIGVEIAIAEVVYCWAFSLAFTRLLMTAYEYGKAQKEREIQGCVDSSRSIDNHSAKSVEIRNGSLSPKTISDDRRRIAKAKQHHPDSVVKKVVFNPLEDFVETENL